MKKRNKSPEGGASWMDTYGDMVTLLLCFFVLLYSISSVDQAKWEIVVKSFNPDAEKVSQIVEDLESESKDDVPGGVDDDFDKLYEQLQQKVQELGLESQVELSKGDGYTFVTFRDNVFFDGDSSVLKEGGRSVLDQFSSAIRDAQDSIQEIRVMGHTSQAGPDAQNDVEFDRMLSAERAARVVAYMQQMSLVSPEKLVSEGYGQYRPIAPFDTEENRAKNRRVELLITKNDEVVQSLDAYYQQIGQ